jgi:NAD(P)-dependent dehydrogenase (short-subunit alcohol dehydrogenase family)
MPTRSTRRRPPRPDRPLAGAVAVVAGATRGAGRGIARALGEAGATVYCTGRSVRGRPSPYNRPEVLEETAELVDRAGGRGIVVRVDHTVEAEVAALFDRIGRDEKRLDLLVNCVAGEDRTFEWGNFGQGFWLADLDQGFGLLRQAVFSHLITAKHAARLMVPRKRGLIVETTDGNTLLYRGYLFYDLVKTTAIRLAYIYAEDLRRHKIAAIAISPGYLRSEAMLDHYGVTEDNWRDGARKDPFFLNSETPLLVGRCIAALAADPDKLELTGLALGSWELARRYRVSDYDGRRPDLVAEFRKLPMFHRGAFYDAGIRHLDWLREMTRRQRALFT